MGASVALTMTNSTLASRVRLAYQVVAPSAMLPTVSMPPRTARQLASLAGASRAAWTVALPQSPRQHWTAALASRPALLSHAWRLLSLVRAAQTTRPHCLMRRLLVLQDPSVA